MTKRIKCLLLSIGVPRFAVGLRIIDQLLKKYDINSRIIHYFYDKSEFSELFDILRKEKHITIVGASIHWYSQIIPTLKYLELIKIHNPNILIVVGGITASYYSNELIKYNFIDFIIKGSGEFPFLELSRKYVLNKNISNDKIPNLIWKKGKKIIVNKTSYLTEEKYINEGETLEIECNYHTGTGNVVYMGQGCYGSCLQCGGGLKGYKKWNNGFDPYIRKNNSIIKSLLNIYTNNDFAYIVHDFDGKCKKINNLFSDIDNKTLTVFKNKSLGIDCWGLPDFKYLKSISSMFNDIVVEISPEVGDEKTRKKARHFWFSNNDLEKLIENCQNINNIKFSLFFGYPNMVNSDKNEYFTLKYIFHLISTFTSLFYRSGGNNLRISFAPMCLVPGSPISESSNLNKLVEYKNYYRTLSIVKTEVGSLSYYNFLNENDLIKKHFFFQLQMFLMRSYVYFIIINSFKNYNLYYKTIYSVFNKIWEIIGFNQHDDYSNLWTSSNSVFGYHFGEKEMSVTIPYKITKLFLVKLKKQHNADDYVREAINYLIKGLDLLSLNNNINLYSQLINFNKLKSKNINSEYLYPQKNNLVNITRFSFNLYLLNKLEPYRLFSLISYSDYCSLIKSIDINKNQMIINNYFGKSFLGGNYINVFYSFWFQIIQGNNDVSRILLYLIFNSNKTIICTILDILKIEHNDGLIENNINNNIDEKQFVGICKKQKHDSVSLLFMGYLLCDFIVYNRYSLMEQLIKLQKNEFYYITYYKDNTFNTCCFKDGLEKCIIDCADGINKIADIKKTLISKYKIDSLSFINYTKFFYEKGIIF